MRERQRWTAEEDAILGAYVKQYGPREWHLVSQRMSGTPLDRDAKSCLERWKNYLKPGIKKGSLTEEEQRLVIRLQAKHGNKWKKIAAEVPGRTAKRLGKWWEVYKEKQERASRENKGGSSEPVEDGKYDRILETFAEKLVRERGAPVMAASSNGAAGFLHNSDLMAPPPWGAMPAPPPPSPSVTLSLSSPAVPSAAPVTCWLNPERGPHGMEYTPAALSLRCLPPPPSPPAQTPTMLVSELMECCRELEEGHRAITAHKKEAAWRLKRVELQLESEKATRRREKMEEIEAKIKALREEERASLERIEAEYREQLVGLRIDAEAKEQKLAEQWAAKHMRISQLVKQIGCRARLPEPN